VHCLGAASLPQQGLAGENIPRHLLESRPVPWPTHSSHPQLSLLPQVTGMLLIHPTPHLLPGREENSHASPSKETKSLIHWSSLLSAYPGEQHHALSSFAIASLVFHPRPVLRLIRTGYIPCSQGMGLWYGSLV